MRSPSCAAASEPQLYTVTDAAGLLTDEQNLQLEKQAAETAAKYGVGVYIVTVDDYRDVDEAGVYEATYGIYHTYTMGKGAERSGIMLLLSMTDRNFGLFRYGERAEYAFTAYGLKQLEKSFLPQFGTTTGMAASRAFSRRAICIWRRQKRNVLNNESHFGIS